MIKALIFDLGGVIVPIDFTQVYLRFEAHSGLTREEIRARLTDANLVMEFECGRLTETEFRGELNRRLGIALTHAEYQDSWNALFDPAATAGILPERFIADLAARYPVLALSNNNETHFNWVGPRYRHLNHMRHVILSHRFGQAKPGREIYDEAVRLAGCAPGECFFTDDGPAYVDAARAAGLDAELFTGEAALREHLSRRGIPTGA
ncbi:MAG: HAD family phosphatase [Acidobacteria bacterium]|nr:HAD family phosphatase [Acidobacteriota bacterium]